MSMQTRLISSLEKCFLDESIESKPRLTEASCLRAEDFHFIFAYTSENISPSLLAESTTLICRSDLDVSFERIENVPVRFPCYPKRSDDNYLRKKAGLYPDLLIPVDVGDPIEAGVNSLLSLFATVHVPADTAAGDYTITVGLRKENGEEFTEELKLHVVNAVAPAQTIHYAQWVHYDCIADAHGVEVFSEKHWEYIRNYLTVAVRHGIDTILTPVFTPPLDTAVGGERPTVQLVDVEKTENGYRFGFDKLHRFVSLCLCVGVKQFEISHLFTQWGAYHAPKVMATVDGKLTRIFGWETDALSDEYVSFLRSFLTALIAEMKALGVDDRMLFHVSDEPKKEQLPQYIAVKEKIADLLCDYPIYDALSDFEFYQTGAVENPIPASDRIEPFLQAEAPSLWTYYCCGQWRDVSNRFIDMPLARARIIGTQFWKYRIAGFLQWGYNFWYSRFSKRRLDPYVITDGDAFAPAGDAFSVYPAPDGKPYRSLRLVSFAEALDDLGAMNLAESLCGREAVLSVLESEQTITFSSYPKDAAFILSLREKINRMIEEKTN